VLSTTREVEPQGFDSGPVGQEDSVFAVDDHAGERERVEHVLDAGPYLMLTVVHRLLSSGWGSFALLIIAPVVIAPVIIAP